LALWTRPDLSEQAGGDLLDAGFEAAVQLAEVGVEHAAARRDVGRRVHLDPGLRKRRVHVGVLDALDVVRMERHAQNAAALRFFEKVFQYIDDRVGIRAKFAHDHLPGNGEAQSDRVVLEALDGGFVLVRGAAHRFAHGVDHTQQLLADQRLALFHAALMRLLDGFVKLFRGVGDRRPDAARMPRHGRAEGRQRFQNVPSRFGVGCANLCGTHTRGSSSTLAVLKLTSPDSSSSRTLSRICC